MAWSPEQRAAARERAAARKAAKNAALAVETTSAEARLLAEIEELRGKLAKEEKAKADVARMGLAPTALIRMDGDETPTGATVEVQRLKGYKTVGHRDDGRPILKAVFEMITVPTYRYRINLPPCGGTDLKINGTPYYHGEEYVFDPYTLASVKDIVYRCWRHDADIHGTDENFYRKPTRQRLSARGM